MSFISTSQFNSWKTNTHWEPVRNCLLFSLSGEMGLVIQPLSDSDNRTKHGGSLSFYSAHKVQQHIFNISAQASLGLHKAEHLPRKDLYHGTAASCVAHTVNSQNIYLHFVTVWGFILFTRICTVLCPFSFFFYSYKHVKRSLLFNNHKNMLIHYKNNR